MLEEKYYKIGPREYLRLYQQNKNKASMLRSVLEEVADQRSAIRLDGLPRKGGINHPTEDAAISLSEAKAKYQPLIDEAETICDDVLDTVNSLEPREARLLYLKYCKDYPWYKVAKELYYSEAYVKKELHTNALEQLDIAMRRKSNERI